MFKNELQIRTKIRSKTSRNFVDLYLFLGRALAIRTF